MNVCCYVLALNRAVWYVHPVHVFAPKGVKDEKKKTRTKEERAALVAEMLGGKIQTVLKKAMSATYRTRRFVSIVIAMGMVHT